MENDLISRSALLADIEESVVFSVKAGQPSAEIRGANKITDRIKAAPAVDAEKLFEQVGLIQTAFEMAKADLVPVVRCKDCKRRGDLDQCPMCFEETVEQCNGEDSDGELCWDVWKEINDRTVDDGFCFAGERRADDAD